MAQAREDLRAEHGNLVAWKFSIDRLEMVVHGGRDHWSWGDVQFWWGNDFDRLVLRSEGEGERGGAIERAEVQALWSRAVTPFFNFLAGARQDFAPGPDRTHLVLGLQGLAPYWLEVEGALFLSHQGDLTSRFELEYDQRITQRLILQPLLEAELSLQDVPELSLGSGLSSAEVGLRLRYEIVPEFAPYVGVAYERAFGDTARFARAAGEETGGWRFLVGLRSWF